MSTTPAALPTAPPSQTVADLGVLVKRKYPEYADLDDAEVGRRVKAKYPEYADFTDIPNAGQQMRAGVLNKAEAGMTQATQAPTMTSSGNEPGIPYFITHGISDIANGIGAMAQGGGPNIARGASGVLRGASQVAAPAAGYSVLAAPVATGIGALAGGTADYLTQKVLQQAGVAPEYQQLAGDVAGLGGGIAAGAGASRLAGDISKNFPGLANNKGRIGRELIQAVPGGRHAVKAYDLAKGVPEPAPTASIPPVKYNPKPKETGPQANIPPVSYPAKPPVEPAPKPAAIPPVKYNKAAPASKPAAPIPPVKYNPFNSSGEAPSPSAPIASSRAETPAEVVASFAQRQGLTSEQIKSLTPDQFNELASKITKYHKQQQTQSEVARILKTKNGTTSEAPSAPTPPPSGPVLQPGQSAHQSHQTLSTVDTAIGNKREVLASYFQANGISPEAAASIPHAERNMHLKAAYEHGKSNNMPVPQRGYKPFDPSNTDTWDQAVQLLRQRAATAPLTPPPSQ